MFKIPNDITKMTAQDKDAAVRALLRILNPEKGIHLPTLVMCTRESFIIEEATKEEEKA